MNTKNKDVETLLGNPKKAMLMFMLPTMFGLLIQNVDSLIDTMWVAGLGPAALAAVGYATPVLVLQMGIGNGIGIGASTIISRYIGMGDKKSADRVMGQAIFLCLIVSACMMVLLVCFGESFLTMMSSGHYIEESMAYLTPLIITCPSILLGLALYTLTRSEGGFKKAMTGMLLAASVNVILDPLFIYDYGLGLGVAGASLATGLSRTLSALLLLYFLFSSKNYVGVDLNRFRIDVKHTRDILRVGLPASIGIVLAAVLSIVTNIVITDIDPVHGMAVFGALSKLLQFLFLPSLAIGAAIFPISAASYGQRRYDKIASVYKHALIVGLAIMTLVAIAANIASEYVVALFTYTDESIILKEDLIFALIAVIPAIILYPLEYVTTYTFQSLGRGLSGLVSSLIKHGVVILMILIAATYYGTMDVFFILYGIGSGIGPIIVALWGWCVIRSLPKKQWSVGQESPT